MDYEARLQTFYEGILVEGDTCVDVGAHVGRHAFPMARCVGPRGKVIAFEPIPALLKALSAEIERDPALKHIELFPYALSDRSGDAEFVVALDTPGFSGLKERPYDYPTRLERIRVETRALDVCLSKLTRLKFIKIDVEGGEWAVIRGARQTIERLGPIVGFEFGQRAYQPYDVNPDDVYLFFASLNYDVFDILGQRLDRPAFVNSAVVQQVWDYVAAPGAVAGIVETVLSRPRPEA